MGRESDCVQQQQQSLEQNLKLSLSFGEPLRSAWDSWHWRLCGCRPCDDGQLSILHDDNQESLLLELLTKLAGQHKLLILGSYQKN